MFPSVSVSFPPRWTTETVPLWPSSHPPLSEHSTVEHNRDESTARNPKSQTISVAICEKHPATARSLLSRFARRCHRTRSTCGGPARWRCSDGFDDSQAHSRQGGYVSCPRCYLHIAQGMITHNAAGNAFSLPHAHHRSLEVFQMCLGQGSV